MPKGTTFCNDILALILNATPITNLADDTSTSPATNLYLALHTANPGAGGNQTTNEASYTNYARVAVPRSTSGFSAPSAASAALAANRDFPVSQGGSTTSLTHASLGTAPTGTGKILWSGSLSASITMATGVIPRITASSTSVTEA